MVNDVESCSEEWNMRSHRQTQTQVTGDNYSQCTCKMIAHKCNSKSKIVQIVSGLAGKPGLGFKIEKDNPKNMFLKTKKKTRSIIFNQTMSF